MHQTKDEISQEQLDQHYVEWVGVVGSQDAVNVWWFE